MNELDLYLDDLGRRLERARPRPRTRLVALVATGALALAAALAASLIGGGSATDHRAIPVGPVDAIAKARAALTVPQGQMLHMRIHIDVEATVHTTTEELWVAAGKPHWRMTWTNSDRSRWTVAFDDGVYSTYNHRANRVKRVTGYADDSPQAKVRSLLGIGDGDIAEQLRTALAEGKLVDRGEQQVGGRTVRRLETGDPQAFRVLTYDVDPQTFAPLGGEEITYLPPRKRGGPRRQALGTMRFTVEAYEQLAIDERTLAVPANARTKVAKITADEFNRRVRELRRWQRACAKLRKHDKRADCGRQPVIGP